MKSKILLINPPLSGRLEAGITNVKVPLGVAYIAAVLEKDNHEVRILDAMADYEKVEHLVGENYRVGTPFNEIKNVLEEFKPDIVGVHCAYTVYEKDSLDIARLVKNILPNSLVVFGGAHASAAAEKLLEDHSEIDIVVRGEAEYTFREIVNKYLENRDLNNIDGTIVSKNGSIITNKERRFIFDLDELPMPARHLLKMDKYMTHPQNDIGTYRKPVTDMITSRGCPQSCTFCSIFTVWKRMWRPRGAKLVVDEMELLVKEYGVKQIRIQDDNFGVHRQRVIDICDEIIKRNLSIKIDTPNGIGIWTLDEEMLEKMAEAGFNKLTFGIETGSLKTLKNHIKKPIDFDHAKNIIRVCNRLGIWTMSTFIIGFPEETMEDIKMTIDFAKNSGLDFAIFYVAQPYQGTPLFEQYKNEGLLDDIQETSSLLMTKYRTHHFSGEELQTIQKHIQKEFIKHKLLSFFNPINAILMLKSKVRNLEDAKFVYKMAKNLVPMDHISFSRKTPKPTS